MFRSSAVGGNLSQNRVSAQTYAPDFSGLGRGMQGAATALHNKNLRDEQAQRRVDAEAEQEQAEVDKRILGNYEAAVKQREHLAKQAIEGELHDMSARAEALKKQGRFAEAKQLAEEARGKITEFLGNEDFFPTDPDFTLSDGTKLSSGTKARMEFVNENVEPLDRELRGFLIEVEGDQQQALVESWKNGLYGAVVRSNSMESMWENIDSADEVRAMYEDSGNWEAVAEVDEQLAGSIMDAARYASLEGNPELALKFLNVAMQERFKGFIEPSTVKTLQNDFQKEVKANLDVPYDDAVGWLHELPADEEAANKVIKAVIDPLTQFYRDPEKGNNPRRAQTLQDGIAFQQLLLRNLKRVDEMSFEELPFAIENVEYWAGLNRAQPYANLSETGTFSKTALTSKLTAELKARHDLLQNNPAKALQTHPVLRGIEAEENPTAYFDKMVDLQREHGIPEHLINPFDKEMMESDFLEFLTLDAAQQADWLSKRKTALGPFWLDYLRHGIAAMPKGSQKKLYGRFYLAALNPDHPVTDNFLAQSKNFPDEVKGEPFQNIGNAIDSHPSWIDFASIVRQEFIHYNLNTVPGSEDDPVNGMREALQFYAANMVGQGKPVSQAVNDAINSVIKDRTFIARVGDKGLINVSGMENVPEFDTQRERDEFTREALAKRLTRVPRENQKYLDRYLITGSAEREWTDALFSPRGYVETNLLGWAFLGRFSGLTNPGIMKGTKENWIFSKGLEAPGLQFPEGTSYQNRQLATLALLREGNFRIIPAHGRGGFYLMLPQADVRPGVTGTDIEVSGMGNDWLPMIESGTGRPFLITNSDLIQAIQEEKDMYENLPIPEPYSL
jgi:hypothetical protein